MVGGIILAAGASSRMGRAKALLPSGDGRTFLERLASAFTEAGLDPLLAVAGVHAGEIAALVRAKSLPLELVVNPRPERGQLSSLVAALDALAGRAIDAVVVTPVDHPFVSAETVRGLVEAWRKSGAMVVRPERDGRHGHPVVFAAALFDELRGGDLAAGARIVIARDPARVLDVPVADAGAFEDIDTPGDYRRLVGEPLPPR